MSFLKSAGVSLNLLSNTNYFLPIHSNFLDCFGRLSWYRTVILLIHSDDSEIWAVKAVLFVWRPEWNLFYLLHFSSHLGKFIARNLHRNLLSGCKFLENWFSANHSSLRDIIDFLSALFIFFFVLCKILCRKVSYSTLEFFQGPRKSVQTRTHFSSAAKGV